MKIINIVLLLLIVAVNTNAQTTTHTVEVGQTFYSIAKMYNTTVSEIKTNNPNIDQNNISVGTVLNIYAKANTTVATPSYNNNNNSPIYHLVAKGETLFGLAKRTYNVAVSDIKAWNNLSENTLSVGQNLIVGWVKDTQTFTNNTNATTTNTYSVPIATNTPSTTSNTIATTTSTIATSTYTPSPTSAVTNSKVTPISEGKVVYTSSVPGRGDLTDLKESRTVYTSTVPSANAIVNTSDKYDTTTTQTVVNLPNPVSETTNATVDKVVNNTAENVETEVVTEDMITKKYGSIATGGKTPPREIFKSLEASNDASLVLKKEEGVAKWFELDDKSIQIYAMHASAPIGSALKITNPLNQTTIYVKVIDTLAPTADNSNTLLRLSSNTMSILKMYDKAFMVNVEYFDVVDK